VPTERHFSGTPWEPEVGYCRAIRRGEHIFVSGTVGLRDDGSVPEGAYEQAEAAIARAVAAIEALSGGLKDVVRTRMYATDPARDFADIARAHREAFGAHPPATSLIGVSSLVAPEFVFEIEVDAIVSAARPRATRS
jgi:isochorismate pyruvate lyase